MSNYNHIGLQNFIFENYKLPLITDGDKVYVKGLETRYVDGELLRYTNDLADKVHEQIMEKLADKIADDVVDRILRQIDENKKEKEEKILY
jgi:hypothetical protein